MKASEKKSHPPPQKKWLEEFLFILKEHSIEKNYNKKTGLKDNSTIFNHLSNSCCDFKEFQVKNFPFQSPSPIALLTSNPDGGLYVELGVAAFIKRYGRAPRSGLSNRLIVREKYKCGQRHNVTGLKLTLFGYDPARKVITNANGAIALLDKYGNTAASWTFKMLLDLWKTKYADCLYIPFQRTKTDVPGKTSCVYGSNIIFGEGATFNKFLSALVDGCIAYEPNMRFSNGSIIVRSQFKIKPTPILLSSLYERLEVHK